MQASGLLSYPADRQGGSEFCKGEKQSADKSASVPESVDVIVEAD